MQDQVKRIHFVGIGGSGMAGIAEVCLNLGFEVTGSDIKRSLTVLKLEKQGAKIQINHDPELVQGADVVVVSSAINSENCEVQWAKSKRIAVIPRAEMLAELMRMRSGIAVAGTHGKTTTTSLTAAILTAADLDPTFVIGGKLNQYDANARLGSGKYLVAEADESDASFLHLMPTISVVTNIDMDHMETYQGDFEQLKATYLDFIHRLPFYGLAVVCLDDPTIKSLIPNISRRVVTYGFDENADVRATEVIADGLCTKFKVSSKHFADFAVELKLPGNHNVQNALASIAVGLELGVNPEQINAALSVFAGVARRFEVYPDVEVGGKQLTLVDDYGHHPTELTATLETARNAYPGQRIVLVFQPHRFSRTRDLFDDFVVAISKADLVVLTPVYAAGEAPLTAFDSKALMQAMRLRGSQNMTLVEDYSEFLQLAPGLLEEDDVLLLMGAGDIGQWCKNLQEEAK